MRLLLDTHIFLWAIAGSRQLKAPARRMIESAETVHVSAASVWEIALKRGLGKLEADLEQVVQAISESGFIELPVRAVHAARTEKLGPRHGDPFDRLLVAQALTEPLRLVTADPALAAYSELVTLV